MCNQVGKRNFNDLPLCKQKLVLYKLVMQNGVEMLEFLDEKDWVDKTQKLIEIVHGLTEPTTTQEFAEIVENN